MEYTVKDELLAIQKRVRDYLKANDIQMGFTFPRHFIERVTQHVNNPEYFITTDDIRNVIWNGIVRYAEGMDNVSGTMDGHFVDVGNCFDMPFVIQKDTSKTFRNMVLLPKTFIRRKDTKAFERGFADGHPSFSVS